MRWLLFLLLFIAILPFSCHRKIQRSFATQVQVSEALPTPVSYENSKSPCKDRLNYAPDLDHPEHTPTKVIRVNFHIMCKNDSTGNFNQADGRGFIQAVLKEANKKLLHNKPMHLPLHNNNPVLPMRYKYQLTSDPEREEDDGIYFHYDDELYFMIAGGRDQNNYTRTVFKKYGIQKGRVLNVFVMGQHTDSLKSATYRPYERGIAFGNWVKVAAWHHMTRKDKWKDHRPVTRTSALNAMRLLHHEIGHTLGLPHTWRGNDGCDDTPNHDNCWNKTKNNSRCDSLWSNNFMDYNAHCSAWSACQIATIHRNLHNRDRLRALLVTSWCSLKEEKTIYINDTLDWNGAKDLEGHLVLQTGAQLTLRCRVSIPPAGKVVIHPGARLILDGGTLHNDCGKKWEGIEILKQGKREGELILTANATIEDVTNEVEIIKSTPEES